MTSNEEEELPLAATEEEQQQPAATTEAKDSAEAAATTTTNIMETANNDKNESSSSPSCSKRWTLTVLQFRAPIQQVLVQISNASAARPWQTILMVIFLSLLLMVTGMFTNMTFESDDQILFTPFGSLPSVHQEWILYESDFPPLPRTYNILLHLDSANVLGMEGIARAFDVLEELLATPGFNDLCPARKGNDADPNDIMDTTCPWSSVTQFWNNSRAIFENEINTDEEAIQAMSAPFFPNGNVVLTGKILGNPVRQDPDDDYSILTSAQSYLMILGLPQDEDVRTEVRDYEKAGVDNVFAVSDAWESGFLVEQINERSFGSEFAKGFTENIPLLAAAFVIMIIFTVVYFSQRHWVYSRAALGVGAVCSTSFAMMAGFGFMFVCGVPITSMHGMLPFILIGIGLDDAFIITSEFFRKPTKLSAEERIQETISEVGFSIFVTTLTSSVAFGLGCISSIPAVLWLCLYAFPCIILDFLFSLTFFVAIIVIDEQRVMDSRKDCLCCFTDKNHQQSIEDGDDAEPSQDDEKGGLFVDRLMSKYATFLRRPMVQAVVVFVFGALFVGCVYSTAQLEQEFSIAYVLPENSYVISFINALDDYTTNGDPAPSITFRFVDQSTEETQRQMEDYVNDLVDLNEISSQPSLFWLRDFQVFVANNTDTAGLDFNQQIALFLDHPVYGDLYSEDIARNADGDVTASRTYVKMDQVDTSNVTAQTDALANQEAVSVSQPVNRDIEGEDWPFFTFAEEYFIWEFYASCPRELALTTIFGVVSVALISTIAVPHWSAVLFVTPMISILYIDLLGVLQFSGVTVNSISYITLTVSIGLMVDFLVHVLLRYYESEKTDRYSKVKDMLETMGASILVGGFTSLLGVLPLALSTLEIFNVVFVTFIGLVTLGLAHGLILLPVIMMLIGPEENIMSSSISHEKTPAPETQDHHEGKIATNQETDKPMVLLPTEDADENSSAHRMDSSRSGFSC